MQRPKLFARLRSRVSSAVPSQRSRMLLGAPLPPSTAVPATVGAAAVSQSPSSPSEIAGVSASLCSSAATLPHLAGNTGSTGGAATFDSVSSPGAYGGASALSAPGGTSSPCSSP
ncbi:unnamed protein product, partial [Pylaiella littoralis]